MQRGTSTRSDEQILQGVASDFCNEQRLQRVRSGFLQRGASGRRKERILRRVASDFLERATSATSNERVLQLTTCTRSNE